jgi:hypothetical protein
MIGTIREPAKKSGPLIVEKEREASASKKKPTKRHAGHVKNPS